MSNLLVIEPTRFEDIRTGTISLGYRVYDNYGQFYMNNEESIPDNNLEVIKTVAEFVKNACEYSEHVSEDMFNYIIEHKQPIMVGNDFLEFSEIKDTLMEIFGEEFYEEDDEDYDY